jgi:flagellar biosynthesis component FlhA
VCLYVRRCVQPFSDKRYVLPSTITSAATGTAVARSKSQHEAKSKVNMQIQRKVKKKKRVWQTFTYVRPHCSSLPAVVLLPLSTHQQQQHLEVQRGRCRR